MKSETITVKCAVCGKEMEADAMCAEAEVSHAMCAYENLRERREAYQKGERVEE